MRGLFSEYGTILDIVAKKSLKRKGQAFVVFETTESAQNAIDDLDGFDLAGKEIRCTFAKKRSDATVKRTGTEQEYDEHVRVRKEKKGTLIYIDLCFSAHFQLERKQAEERAQQANKKRPAADAATASKPKAPRLGAGDGPPSSVLIVQGIPDDYDDTAMSAIFGRLAEFKEFHSVPGRKGLGFAHYETVEAATRARSNLANLELAGSKLIITFRKA